VMIGLFLFFGAQLEERSAVFQSVLQSVRLEEVMLTDFATLSPADTLEDALEKAVHTLQDDFPVVRGSDMVGVVSKQKILEALRAEGNGYVQAVMIRIFEVAAKQESLASAFRKLSANNHAAFVGKRADQAVSVACREDSDTGWFLSGPAGVISDTSANGKIANGNYSCPKRKYRPHMKFRFHLRVELRRFKELVIAVEDLARTHHLIPGRRAADNRRAVGHVHDPGLKSQRAHAGERGFKCLFLLDRLLGREDLRRREVCKCAFQAQVRAVRERTRKCGNLRRRDA